MWHTTLAPFKKLVVISGVLVVLLFSSSCGSGQLNSGASTETFTLGDGSVATIVNISTAPDWACGFRKTGQLEGAPAGSPPVILYLDRASNLVSIRTDPKMGSQTLYDLSNGRECLMNWVTKQDELLTKEQYQQYEREAGVAEPRRR